MIVFYHACDRRRPSVFGLIGDEEAKDLCNGGGQDKSREGSRVPLWTDRKRSNSTGGDHREYTKLKEEAAIGISDIATITTNRNWKAITRRLIDV